MLTRGLLSKAGFSSREISVILNLQQLKMMRRVALAAERPPLGPVPAEAIAWLLDKRLSTTEDFDNQSVWAEEHDLAFTVAGIVQKDLLQDVKESLVRALEKGESFQTWKRNFTETLDKKGWSAFDEKRRRPHRLFTIYRTNMRTARAVGQWQRIETTAETHPFLLYNLGPSENHRETHVAFAGTIARADDPVWDTWFPPNGFGCNCHIRQLSRREAELRGGEVAPPDLGVDENTGLPRGIDPGFDSNPGKTRAGKLRELKSTA